MRQRSPRALPGVLLAVSLLLPGTSFAANAAEDVRNLLLHGPRVAGSDAIERSRVYLEGQFRALGYQTRRESFTYDKDVDLGSSVTVGGQEVKGRALRGSVARTVQGEVRVVPGVGTPEELARAGVRGRIAVVQRGQIDFLTKARNALAAGAVGLVIVNNSSGDLMGTLGSDVALPVLGLSPEAGAALKDGVRVTLTLRGQRQTVKGVNVVAFKSGVTRPDVLFGAHMDSVEGSPGANDNASGTAAVVDIARRVANTPMAARSFFVLFDAEEDGLRGSRAFVQDNAELTRALKLMLNFDMVGVSVTPLQIGGAEALEDVVKRVAPQARIMPDSGGSDHASFEQAGVNALFFHRGIDEHYHRPGDVEVKPELVEEAAAVAVAVATAVVEQTR